MTTRRTKVGLKVTLPEFPHGRFQPLAWILIFGVVILLLFGGNRFSAMMGDVAKGLKSFKQGMTDEDETSRSRSAGTSRARFRRSSRRSTSRRNRAARRRPPPPPPPPRDDTAR